jgi:hypothetical protein
MIFLNPNFWMQCACLECMNAYKAEVRMVLLLKVVSAVCKCACLGCRRGGIFF